MAYVQVIGRMLLYLLLTTPLRPSGTPTVPSPRHRHTLPYSLQILKHLQVNKFKVLLAVVMDLPLTFLNLYILWMEEPELIQNPLFLTSLIIAVFSAGKISTLIEYHLELRQRKRKLERLLMVRKVVYILYCTLFVIGVLLLLSLPLLSLVWLVLCIQRFCGQFFQYFCVICCCFFL